MVLGEADDDVRSAHPIIAVATTALTLAAAAGLAVFIAREAIEPSRAAATTTVARLVRAGGDRPVVFRGRPAGGLRRASMRFALRGEAGGVIDVVPGLGTLVPRMARVKSVRVTGRLMTVGGRPLIVARQVQAVPRPPSRGLAARHRTIVAIRRKARALDRTRATVVGRVRRVILGGFVLADGRRRLFVSTEALVRRRATSRRRRVEVDRRVLVVGQIQRLSAVAAKELARRVGGSAPAGTGDPYLVARTLA